MGALQQCRDDNAGGSGSESDFYRCMVTNALPGAYRVPEDCLNDDKADLEAVVCASHNDNVQKAYDAYKEVDDCYQDNKDSDNLEEDMAGCLAENHLTADQRYYLDCVTTNAGSYGAIAACALSKNMNPEWQIAVSCAVSTGGQPYAFAACTGGRLFAREISKCFEHGIGTDDGCFGPNNEYVKQVSQLDDVAKHAFGENSTMYQAFHLYESNVLAPGPNNDFVKAANTALNDVQHGPGPNNDVVKFIQRLPQPKIGNVRLCFINC